MSQVGAVDEALNRMASKPGVVGVLVVNADGIPIKSTFSTQRAVELQYAGLISTLVQSAIRTVAALDGADELVSLRLRSEKHEIVASPENGAVLVVVQEPRTEE